jgi:asparagine synthase (glutamine-hydrolysing)
MGARMRHRGPDGGGVAEHPDATLGMRRLAIVDIAGGEQPMLSDDGALALVYNGEVYNAPALRAELAREGVRFRTRSDTEVILRLFERDPDRVEERLVGMWALAVHDRRRGRVVLSRDRFGIKPLFLADCGGGVAFASELQCFDPVRGAHPAAFAVDGEAAHAMLAWSYVPEVHTIYRGVRRLPPATRLEIDLATGARRERAYWELRPSEDARRVRSLDDAERFVAPLLARAAREHLESDVPVAAFLSGGIDSALVAAYAVEASARPITAFSIGFREPAFDESPAARETAARLGVEHHVTILDEQAARAAVADALLAYDEPFGDSSSVATLLLARVVAATHKVALGGDGGDEVFAGYRKHKILRVRRALGAAGVRELAARVLARLPARTDRTSPLAELSRTAARLARGLAGTDAEANVLLAQVVPLARAAPLAARPSSGERFLEPGLSRFARAHGDVVQRTLACDLASPLANDMLTKVDRATMAVSLEARVPLLDHRVVEAGLGLPAEYTLPRGKRVLRALHARRFGEALARRRKQGFGVPVERWLRGTLAPACDALFDRERLGHFGVLAPDALGGGAWRRVAETDAQVLWHALALAVWCEATHGRGPAWVREVLG